MKKKKTYLIPSVRMINLSVKSGYLLAGTNEVINDPNKKDWDDEGAN